MKKSYKKPTIENIIFEDVIVTSGGLQDDAGVQNTTEQHWSQGDF